MRALVVDDEVIALNAMIRSIQWEKYDVTQVVTARSMAKAQELFNEDKIDFMLCDIEMPDGSGLELLEWVKIYYPATECIFVTGHAKYDYLRQAMRLGSADYVLKPVDYEELHTVLNDLVGRLRKHKISERVPEEILRMFPHEKQENPLIQSVKDYILEHISETIFIENIAESVHLNAQYLMRAFKKEEGMSILEYMTKYRIELASQLLVNTDYPINRVADMVGYGNYSYFSKLFRRETGWTPVQYRKDKS